MVELDQRPLKKPKIDEEQLEDEIVVNHPDRQKVYNFNGTAAFIWSLSTGDFTLDEIVDEIQQTDPTVPRSEVEEDVRRFVKELHKKELIKLESD